MNNFNGLQFSLERPETITEVLNKSTKWNVDAQDLVKNSVFGLVTVYDNAFGYERVFSDMKRELKTVFPKFRPTFKRHTHCEFCGQAITYVAIVVAMNKNDRNDVSVRQIGCDCLGKIFGAKWYGYRTATRIKSELVRLAAIRSRIAKNAVKYKSEIEWFESLPATMFKNEYVLIRLYELLKSGKYAISKKQLEYLRKSMKSPKFDPKKWDEIDRLHRESVTKLNLVLHLVEEVDGTNISKPWSAHGFVNNVLQNMIQWNRVPTPKQMDAINKVYQRYCKSKTTVTMNTALTAPVTDEMPW